MVGSSCFFYIGQGSGIGVPVLLQPNSKSHHHAVHLRVEYKTAIAVINIEPAVRQKERVFLFEFLSNCGKDLPAKLRAGAEATHIAFQGRKPAFFQIEPEAHAQHRIDKVLAAVAGKPTKNPWV